MAAKIKDGTYKQCLHGPADAVFSPDGKPEKPDSVADDPIANAFWDRHVAQLITSKVARAIDEPALECLCKTWSLMVRVREELDHSPSSKDYRISYSAYSRQWESLAKEFGLTPAARKKIVVETDENLAELKAKYG